MSDKTGIPGRAPTTNSLRPDSRVGDSSSVVFKPDEPSTDVTVITNPVAVDSSASSPSPVTHPSPPLWHGFPTLGTFQPPGTVATSPLHDRRELDASVIDRPTNPNQVSDFNQPTQNTTPDGCSAVWYHPTFEDLIETGRHPEYGSYVSGNWNPRNSVAGTTRRVVSSRLTSMIDGDLPYSNQTGVDGSVRPEAANGTNFTAPSNQTSHAAQSQQCPDVHAQASFNPRLSSGSIQSAGGPSQLPQQLSHVGLARNNRMVDTNHAPHFRPTDTHSSVTHSRYASVHHDSASTSRFSHGAGPSAISPIPLQTAQLHTEAPIECSRHREESTVQPPTPVTWKLNGASPFEWRGPWPLEASEVDAWLVADAQRRRALRQAEKEDANVTTKLVDQGSTRN